MTRSEIVPFRVTAKEKKWLQSQAKAAGLSLGDYVRMRTLGENASTTQYATVSQVRGLEAQVTALANQIQNRHFGGGGNE